PLARPQVYRFNPQVPRLIFGHKSSAGLSVEFSSLHIFIVGIVSRGQVQPPSAHGDAYGEQADQSSDEDRPGDVFLALEYKETLNTRPKSPPAKLGQVSGPPQR